MSNFRKSLYNMLPVISVIFAAFSGFFQATYWGLTRIYLSQKTSAWLAASTFLIWVICVIFCFQKSKTSGFISLLGALPASIHFFMIGALIYVCAFHGSCI